MTTPYVEFITPTTNVTLSFNNSKNVAHAFMLVKAVGSLILTRLDATNYTWPSPENLLTGVVYPFACTKIQFDTAGAVVALRLPKQTEDLSSGGK